MWKKTREYILDHDNRWSFILAYITLAVVLALWINLFWLAMVVAVHGVFEWVVHRQATRDKVAILSRVLWELKLDFGLILFGLALEVYMEVVLGVVGLGAAARAAAAGGRFAILQNLLRGALLSVDDAAQVVRMVAAKKSGEGADGDLDVMSGPEVEEAVVESPVEELEGGRLGPWKGPYSRGDVFSIGFGIFWLVMILLAPYLLADHNWATVWAAIGGQLDPWPWHGVSQEVTKM